MNMGMDGLKRGWRKHAMRKRAESPGSLVETAAVPAARARFGLLGKITIFLVLVLLPVAIVSWIIAYRSLQENLTRSSPTRAAPSRTACRAPRRTWW